jgi:hypothetical protein
MAGMAKSNRQRKRDRAVRQAKSARKQAAVQTQRVYDAVIEQVLEARQKVLDPQTPVGEVADLLAQTYAGSPIPARTVEELQSAGAAPERLVQIAEALRAAEHDAGRDESLTYLLFAAGAAHAAGDGGQAHRLLDEALRILDILDGLDDDDDEPQIWIRIMGHLRLLGRGADALELTEDRLRRDPEDQAAAEQYAAGISNAFKLVAADGAAAHPREQAALDRFADRSDLAELQDAVAAYIPRSRYRESIEDSVAGWLSIARDWDPRERAGLAVLVEEQAPMVATPSPDGTAMEDPGGDDDSTGLLRDFAADGDVPAALRERVRVWREHVHYGLWQVAEPDPAPGVECIDITTGVLRYVEFPAEMIERLPRWGVLFGPVVPVEGIWRSTGNAVQLSPSEADAMAETLMDALEGLVQDLAGESSKRAFRRARQPIPFGHAGPHDVLAYHGDGPGPQTIQLMNYVACSLLPRLTVDLHDHRAAPPAMRNSDGDPLKVISARIAVRDAATLAGRLADHADFRRDEDDPAKLVWLGRLIPEDQRAVMLANLNRGIDTDDPGIPGRPDDDGPQRWVRGQLEIAGRELTVEVNSEHRLARLLGVLTKLGESPSVIDETQVDPAQDLAWPAGPVAIPRGAAPAEEGWEKHWLDGPVPALRGRTPRETAESGDWPVLEAMLRQFEYEADILAASGQSGVDTAYLRAELNLPADPWEINR